MVQGKQLRWRRTKLVSVKAANAANGSTATMVMILSSERTRLTFFSVGMTMIYCPVAPVTTIFQVTLTLMPFIGTGHSNGRSSRKMASPFYKTVYTQASFTIPEGGKDTLLGGAGDDWLFGEGGEDMLDGGADNDVAFGGQGNDRVFGSSGNDNLSGDALDIPDDPQNSLAGNLHGNDYLEGGEGTIPLYGNGGDDTLLGGADDDKLSGDDDKTPGQYHGEDLLYGGNGNDTLWGNGGKDELIGGDGNDHLEGDHRFPRYAIPRSGHPVRRDWQRRIDWWRQSG